MSLSEKDGAAPSHTNYGRVMGSLFVLATTLFARVAYVSLYAGAVPYWDQWDELALQVQPWFAGTWHLPELFAAHLEHRIAFTRIVTIALATINDHIFDNLVEAYFNAVFYAVLWATLCALLVRSDSNKARITAITLATAALGTLPFDWENILIGFQNSFFFMEFCAILLIGVAAWRRSSVSTLALLTALAIVSLFTMASGLLAGPAVCFALLLYVWRDRRDYLRVAAGIALMAIVTIAGLVLLKLAPADTSAHAKTVADYLGALGQALVWPLSATAPLPARWAFALMLWAPAVVWVALFVHSRRGRPDEVFAASLTGWVFLQCLAIAYARGHGMSGLTSRYTEITAIGIAANLWLAIKLASRTQRMLTRVAAAAAIFVGVGFIAWAFWHSTPGSIAALQRRHMFTEMQTHNVQNYLDGTPLPNLPSNSQQIPYPRAKRLGLLLDNPEIRDLLAPTVRSPVAPLMHAPLTYLAADVQASVRRLMGYSPKVASAGTVTFKPVAKHDRIYTPNALCSLDIINGRPATSAGSIQSNSRATFSGWVTTLRRQSLARGRFILQDTQHTYAAPFVTGVRRPDVAKALRSNAAADAGYTLTTSLTGVAAGTYSMYAVDAANPATLCDFHRTLVVTGARG